MCPAEAPTRSHIASTTTALDAPVPGLPRRRREPGSGVLLSHSVQASGSLSATMGEHAHERARSARVTSSNL